MFFSENSHVCIEKSYPLRVQRAHIDDMQWKRTSQSASEDGSVTVEAAIVIPLLLCAFMAVIMWGRVFLLQQEMETALLETAKQIARQEALLTSQEKEGIGILSAGILLGRNREQGDDSYGLEVSTVNLIKSVYRQETKEVCLVAEYRVKMPVLLFGTWSLPLRTSVTQKAWNGYAPASGEEGRSGEYVYITEHGVTYHTDGQCYHLHVTVNSTEEVEQYYEGETSYRSCEFCVTGQERQNILFIAEDGECYHEDLACSGLTRTVHYVPIEEVGGRRLCADCGSG